MGILQDIQELAANKKVPDIKTGDTVRVHQKIKEGEKERVQIFEGLVIKTNSGHGADSSFTVRKIASGVGVEKIFPIYSTNIVKIEIKKKSKVRQSKLYYMRDRSGKSARLKETFVSNKELEEAIDELAEQKAKEAAEAEDSQIVEEPQIAEEPQAAEEPQIAEEPQAVDAEEGKKEE